MMSGAHCIEICHTNVNTRVSPHVAMMKRPVVDRVSHGNNTFELKITVSSLLVKIGFCPP